MKMAKLNPTTQTPLLLQTAGEPAEEASDAHRSSSNPNPSPSPSPSQLEASAPSSNPTDPNPPPSRSSLILHHLIDITSIFAAWIATNIILDVNTQDLPRENCTPTSRGTNWPLLLSLLRYLPSTFRCPTLALYAPAIITMISIFTYQSILAPPFFMDLVLPFWILSVLAKIFISQEAMVIICALGIFTSLVVTKPLAWIKGPEWKGKSFIKDRLQLHPQQQ